MSESAIVLPVSVVREDTKLEKAASGASEALMKHRWHWTLDETNPKRVSLRAYARAVGKGNVTIRKYAYAYVALSEQAGSLTPSEALERAVMGSETQAATEAIAKARGVGFKQTRMTRPSEVQRVRSMARERAEKHGTSVEEEAVKVADWIVKSEKADAKQTQERKQRLGLRYIEIEGKLSRMKALGVEVLNISHDVNLGDEEQELLRYTLETIKALLSLIDLRLAGAADVDWDAELAKLDEAGAA
jgi:hypothetical protein